MRKTGNYIDRGERLKEFFLTKKIKSKRAFAELLEISEQSVNKYFDGLLDPLNLSDQLIKLNCNLHWIATGTGTMSSFTVMEPNAQYNTNQQLLQTIEEKNQIIEMLAGELEEFRRRLSSQAISVILETIKQTDAHKRKSKKQVYSKTKT